MKSMNGLMNYRRLSLNLLLLTIIAILTACTRDQLTFPPVTDAKIRGYCGTCHMAYQPSMLPAASWRLIMASLDEHFDEKVILKPNMLQHITDYHVVNAGDSKAAGRAGVIALQGLQADARLLRITDTPYFKHEHNFLENRILGEWVGSEANCPVCHLGAWVGDYRL